MKTDQNIWLFFQNLFPEEWLCGLVGPVHLPHHHRSQAGFLAPALKSSFLTESPSGRMAPGIWVPESRALTLTSAVAIKHESLITSSQPAGLSITLLFELNIQKHEICIVKVIQQPAISGFHKSQLYFTWKHRLNFQVDLTSNLSRHE